MAQTIILPKTFNRVERLSSYNHNVYINSNGVYIREQSNDYGLYHYYEVDVDDKVIKYLGAENFSIFDSDSDVVFLDDYFC
jgi:hypothetical protein